jgi:hypothetical protein
VSGPTEPTGAAGDDAPPRAEQSTYVAPGSNRPDPRLRPSDPVGTRPKFEPDDLLPPRALPAPDMMLTAESFAPPSAAVNGPKLVEAVNTMDGQAGMLARAQVIIGALVALGVIAAAAVAIAVSRPGPGPSIPWSSWHPVNSDVDPAVQIADHVQPEYLGDGAQPLVQVTGSPLTIGGVPGLLALYASGGNLQPVASNTVMYQLEGSGANGSIAGTASTQRLLLLTREALELALYTFRYVSSVSAVVVTIPPPPPGSPDSCSSSSSSGSSGSSSSGSSSSSTSATSSPLGATASTSCQRALLFRPQDVAGELSRPLNQTLSGPTPSVAAIKTSALLPLLTSLTDQHLYNYIIDTQDASVGPLMVLSPQGISG